MLAATAAKLLASLDLDTKPFEAGARRVGSAMGGMENRFSKIGGMAKRGLGNVATNLTRLGVVAAGAIAVAVRSGIASLADLERANQQTGAVIESTGGKAGVTAQQVRSLAESLEAVTTADDKAIQSGENLLLTFTNIGKDSFPQATKAMVDMAIALAEGDVEAANFKGSAIQIGKALNDPIRGMTALRKSGVSFTEQQEKTIKKLVESGDVMAAQKIILAELEFEFGKAGAAAGTGFGGDLRRLDDAFEDSRMALATGFLPVIRKVADALTTKLADPVVQQQIRDFGVTLAGAFDRLLEIGGKLPWGQIADSLKIAGAGAKALFDAFTTLPPWVQTAVLTGWGLNKLSGGMLGGIVGELGKGLIKGVLGMNAGVVNAKAGVVNVMGGVGGKGPGGVIPVGGKTGGMTALGLLGGAFTALAVAAMAEEFEDEIQGLGKDIGLGWREAVKDATGVAIPTIDASQMEWPFGPKNTPTILPEIFGGNGLLGGNRADPTRRPPPRSGPSAPMSDQDLREANRIAQVSKGETRADAQATRDRIEALRNQTKASGDQAAAAQLATRDRLEALRIAQASQQSATRSAARGDLDRLGDRVVSALERNRTSVYVEKGDSHDRTVVKTGQVANRARDRRTDGSGGLGGT